MRQTDRKRWRWGRYLIACAWGLLALNAVAAFAQGATPSTASVQANPIQANPGPRPAAISPGATYRTVVRAEDVASWMVFRADAPFLRGRAAIDGLVLVTSLADQAESSGLAHRPDVRIDLLRTEGRDAMAWLRREVSRSVAVSDDAVEAGLVQSPPRGRPRRVRLRNLFLRWPDGDGAGVEARAEVRAATRAEMASLRRALDAGADFADLARQHSQSETRWRGGLLGNVRPGTFRPEIERVIADLDVGETSAPVEAEDGLTLLHCEGILPAEPADVEAWRTRIENRLWRASFNARWAARLQALDAMAALENGPAYDDIADGDIAHRYRGGSLTSAERAAVVGVRGSQTVDSVPAARQEAAIQTFLRGQMARQLRDESGWRPDAETRVNLRWRRLQNLANHQLATWVGARFTPPTDDALRDHHRAHPERFAQPRRLHVSAIQLTRDPYDPRADAARGVAVLRSIRTGQATFAEAARQHSSHASAPDGGRLAPIERPALGSRLGLDLMRVVEALAVGEVSELVTTEDALWILRFDADEPARAATFEESRIRVRDAIVASRLAELEAEIVSEWLDSLAIEMIE